MPLIAEPPKTVSTPVVQQAVRASAVTVATGGYNLFMSPSAEDYLVEAPIAFVDGLEAHPTREPQDEPSGSGPFGF